MYQDLQYQAVIDLIHSTRALVLDRHKAGEITQKGRSDLPPSEDNDVQTYMQTKLHEQYPDVRSLPRRTTMQHVDPARPYWILDPIDVHHQPDPRLPPELRSPGPVGREKLVFGCCNNPFQRRPSGRAGKGAYLNVPAPSTSAT